MMQKFIAIVCVLSLILCAVGCGSKEEASSSTVTGTVVSMDGTKITIQIMDSPQSLSSGNRPSMPEGFENGQMPEGFEGFNGKLPEGFEGFGNGQMPEGFEGFNGKRPEGFENGEFPDNFNPEDFKGQLPEGFNGKLPEGFENGELPEDFKGQMPENGERPSISVNLDEDAETKTIEIGKAHISLEIEDGKASGTVEDVKVGSFVTITLNEKGEATNVLVSQSSGFGGMMGQMGSGQRPQRGDRNQNQNREENKQSTADQAA